MWRRSRAAISFTVSRCASKIFSIGLFCSTLIGVVAIGATVFGLRGLPVRRFLLASETFGSGNGDGSGGFRARRFFFGIARQDTELLRLERAISSQGTKTNEICE